MNTYDYSEGMPIDAVHIDDSDADGVLDIVRVKTSWWCDEKGMYQRKDIRFMKRMSKGTYNLLKEDASNIGAEEVFCAITNLDECEDGLYTVNTTNVQRDWETDCVDSYDYVLIPYHPKPKQP
jgi:hypothetical protein